MIKNKIVLALLSFISCCAQASGNDIESQTKDFVFVNGLKYELNYDSFGKEYNFTFPENPKVYYRLVTTVPVVGDMAQSLNFTVNMRAKGLGYYDSGFRCLAPISRYPVDPMHPFLRENLGDLTQLENINPKTNSPCYLGADTDNQFNFSVSMSVYCNSTSRKLLGSDSANRDTLLSQEQVNAIRDSLDTRLGVVGNPYEREREVNLFIDVERESGEACSELRIELSGWPLTEIYDVTGDILILESF
ncbi:hypothetical protein ACJJH9_02990 [Microbulbifer sp. DLAB2-AF]|uniref:hypothetical protein n=1 Tax=Microbulbifer sp. DLAB2-AF TaxID=3243395 RepID=UPI00403931B9